MAADPLHDRLLRIALSLPEAEEDWPWGSIHCKVAGKIFVGWSRRSDGAMSVGLRTSVDLQSMLVASDPRFTVAKYTGKYGGLDLRLAERPDWAEVEQLIAESYRIVAPKRLARRLGDREVAGEPGRVAPEKTTPKRTIPKKTTPKESTPKKSTPKESTPKRTIPKKTTPKKSTPKKSTPKGR